MSQIYLSFYGDGPLWDNIINIPAYPSGISYYRPFRYRDKWIQPEILGEIESAIADQSLVGHDAILCMRFFEEKFKWHILPVRKVKIIKVDYFPDSHSIYFNLGAFFDFNKHDSLDLACLVLPPTEYANVSDCLLFRSGLPYPDSSFINPSQEAKAWVDYSEKMTHDTSLPINGEARKSLFLRFELPESEKVAPISIIHESKHRGMLYGPVVSEGKPYELIISHRIPVLMNKKTTTQPIMMDITSPSSNFEISPTNEEITGNYQSHIITIFPKKPSGVWEEIVISPQKDAKALDGMIFNTRNLKIPIKIKLSLLYRFRSIYIWLGLVWTTLFLSLIFEKLLNITGNESNNLLILGVAISTLLASISLFILQQKGISIK